MSLSVAIRFDNQDQWLDFRDMSAGVSFDLTPEAAVAFFQAKGLQPSFSWMDMIGEEHDKAFTVAKMMDVDLLADVRKAVDQAISEGKSIDWFRKNLTSILQQKGWWGKKTVIDPLTGNEVEVQLGSARRLNTIYRTNMQAAYAAGSWGQIQAQAKVMPWLMYDAVDDHRTRPEHAQWDGLVLAVTDSFWQTHTPPNGWNCRCGTIQLTDAQLKRRGLKPGRSPKIKTEQWTNPRTGKTHQVPIDLDPGWDHNPGINHHKRLETLLSEKIGTLPADMQEAANAARIAAVKARAAYKSELAAKVAKAEAVKSEGVTALARAQEKAKQKAIAHQLEKDAEAKIQGILENPKGQTLKHKALAGLDITGLTQVEVLAKVEEIAAAAQAKANTASLLSGYKKKTLEGKIPTPAQIKAFEALPEAEKNAFLQKLSAATQEKENFVAAYTDAYAKQPSATEIAGFLKSNKKTKAAVMKALDEIERANIKFRAAFLLSSDQ
ncbi:MAG: minor capsid protein [Chromatiaceae bacterium]|nr:minor capsid protein [Chromatiaceae bacterium]